MIHATLIEGSVNSSNRITQRASDAVKQTRNVTHCEAGPTFNLTMAQSLTWELHSIQVSISSTCYTVMQRQTAVTAYFSSKQLLLFGFALCSMATTHLAIVTG